ncbi:MAG: hypothetical protein WCZ89_04010 [Phycisphaerae bacterium]
MKKRNDKSWTFSRQINLSVVVQLILLASLIITSWLNLQRQLDLLQYDVTRLLQTQKEFQDSLQNLSYKMISCEHRICTLENSYAKSDCNK